MAAHVNTLTPLLLLQGTLTTKYVIKSNVRLLSQETSDVSKRKCFILLPFRFVKCEKCSHFFVLMGSDADAKNRSAKGQIDGPEIQNAQQGNP